MPKQTASWLKNLIIPHENKKLTSHSTASLVNDMVHSTLRTYLFTFFSTAPYLILKYFNILPLILQYNLVGTQVLKRITWYNEVIEEQHVDLGDWKPQFESLQIEKETLEQEKDALQQEAKVDTAELETTKAGMK